MKTLPYLEFRLAQARHQQCLSSLAQADQRAIHLEAVRQWRIEEQILGSDEGRACRVTAEQIMATLATIRERYSDLGSYRADLAANSLSEAVLYEAIERELRVDAVLEIVAAGMPPVTMQDAEIFYWQHRSRFEVPEMRGASHILLTVSDVLPGKHDAAVRADAEGLCAKLGDAPETFSALAMRYSECPTALQDGNLGRVPRGQLYPELDEALFAMTEGEIRAVASPLGWHVLRCDEISPAGMRAFEDVAEQLLKNIAALRSKKTITSWLKQLESIPVVLSA